MAEIVKMTVAVKVASQVAATTTMTKAVTTTMTKAEILLLHQYLNLSSRAIQVVAQATIETREATQMAETMNSKREISQPATSTPFFTLTRL
jgi:uncharacterized protein YabE (DUF348 family)